MAVRPIDSEPTPRATEPTAIATEAFQALHMLALRTSVPRLPPGYETLLEEGLVEATDAGFELTPLGHRSHRILLGRERATLDLDALGLIYARIPALGRRLRRLCTEWEGPSGEATRRRLVHDFCELASESAAVIRRTAGVAPRFSVYLTRLDAASGHLRAGQLQYATDASVDSVDMIWHDLHEDYLQTLGRAHDQVLP